MCRCPFIRPVPATVIASVSCVEGKKGSSIGIVAFNIGEIKEGFFIVLTVFANLLIADMQVARAASPVKVSGHINEPHAGIIIFQF